MTPKQEIESEYKKMLSIYKNLRLLTPIRMIYGTMRLTVEYGEYREVNVIRLFNYAIQDFKGEDKITPIQREEMLKDILQCNFYKKPINVAKSDKRNR